MTTGTSGNDTLFGGSGNDTIFGAEGDDRIEGGGGNDSLDGGMGNDTVVLSGNRSDYEIVRLTSGAMMAESFTVRDLRVGAPDGNDTITGVETLRFADGSLLSTSTIGGKYVGGASYDYFHASNGPDTISGGGGNDHAYGNLGDDEFTGGSGDDTFQGAGGTDTAVFSGNRSDYTITELPGGEFTVRDNRAGSPDGTDRLGRDVEKLKFADETMVVSTEGTQFHGTSNADSLTGGDANDQIFGNWGNDTLVGGAGSDLLYGVDGDDRLDGGAGNDLIDGGMGSDTVLLTGNRADYQIVRMAHMGETFLVRDIRPGSPDGYDWLASVETLRFADGSELPTSDIGAVIAGGDWMDNLWGSAGPDTILGGGSMDYLYGNGGNDEITGGSGNDSVFGGAGTDTAVFSGNKADYTIIELSGGGIEVRDTRAGSPDGTDRLARDVEKLSFADSIVTVAIAGVELSGNNLAGGEGNDTLQGTMGQDSLRGGGGSDILSGGEGDDKLEGGAGNDSLDGGMGTDSILLTGVRSDYEIVRLSGNPMPGMGDSFRVRDLRAGSPDGDDIIVGVETINFADQTSLSTATIGALFTGGDKNDQFFGTTGPDTASGGGGADAFYANSGDDEFTGGTGNDSFYGGAGTDTAVFSGARADYTIILLAGGEVVVKDNRAGSPDGEDRYARDVHGGMNADSLTGGDGNDNIYANSGNDTLVGGAGSDFLHGSDGDDRLDGGTGNDSIDGGMGNDVAILTGSRADYQIVRLMSGMGDTIQVRDLRTGTPDGADILVGIETLRFADGSELATSSIGTLLAGTDHMDHLSGTTGPDTISGGAGNDNLFGHGGDDGLNGGSGNDSLQGGAGNDSAIFSGNRSDYVIKELSGGAFEVRDIRTGSPDGTDLLNREVEKLVFADQTLTLGTFGLEQQGTHNADSLTGGAYNDNLHGQMGNDTLVGGAGSDFLSGSDGEDRLEGGAGNDSLDGGWGSDVAILTGNRSDYEIVRLNGGMGMSETIRVRDLRAGAPDGDDILTSVETIRFADGTELLTANVGSLITGTAGMDYLYGTWSSDTMLGGAGNDMLYGQSGDDELIGESGSDTLSGGTGTDTAVFSGKKADYVITFLTGGEIEVKHIRAGSPNGTDRIMRDVEKLKFADQLVTVGIAGTERYGGSNADTFTGGEGNDYLYGWSGNDTLAGGAGSDVLQGSDGDDKLEGGAGSDSIDGGIGNDVAVLSGNRADYEIVRLTGMMMDSFRVRDLRAGSPDGNDLVVGVESLRFGDGSELLLANIGALFNGGESHDYFYGSTGADTVNTGGGDDHARGGAANDKISGGSGSDWLYGDDGNDTLMGGSENDYLYGGVGDDLIDGGSGSDELQGGDGRDVLTGGSEHDRLFAGAGDDRLDGGTGNDTLYGGAGNDTYTVDSSQDFISEIEMGVDAGGTELVMSTATFTLAEYFENLTLTGTADIDGTGNALGNKLTGNSGANAFRGLGGNDTITGNAGLDALYGGDGNDNLSGGTEDDFLAGGEGTDILNGGTGADTMQGGAGNDTYTVDDAGDVVSEETVEGMDDGGLDLVNSAFTFVLDDFIENLTLTGAGEIDGTGNDIANKITGNNAANILRGGGGNDSMVGNGGNDFVYGEAGNDTLSGGIGDDWMEGGDGLDQLSGGTGLDKFVLAGGPDKIMDFNKTEGDQLVLKASDYAGLAAGGPVNIVTNATGLTTSEAGVGQFVYNSTSKTLFWDADGSGGNAAIAIASFATTVSLGSSDFLII